MPIKVKTPEGYEAEVSDLYRQAGKRHVPYGMSSDGVARAHVQWRMSNGFETGQTYPVDQLVITAHTLDEETASMLRADGAQFEE